jgi:hypothetical protein
LRTSWFTVGNGFVSCFRKDFQTQQKAGVGGTHAEPGRHGSSYVWPAAKAQN